LGIGLDLGLKFIVGVRVTVLPLTRKCGLVA